MNMETLMDVEQGLLYGPMWLGGFHWKHHLQKGAWNDGNAQMRLHVCMAQGGGKAVHCTLHSVLPWADGLGMILQALTFFLIMWIQRSPPVFASFASSLPLHVWQTPRHQSRHLPRTAPRSLMVDGPCGFPMVDGPWSSVSLNAPPKDIDQSPTGYIGIKMRPIQGFRRSTVVWIYDI